MRTRTLPLPLATLLLLAPVAVFYEASAELRCVKQTEQRQHALADNAQANAARILSQMGRERMRGCE